MTVGVPLCTVAQTELVVPRSMPMTSSPKMCLQRAEQRPGLLVVWVLLQQRGQLRSRPRLQPVAGEETRQQQARAEVLRIQLHRAQGPGGGGARIRALLRAAGGTHGGEEAGRVVLERGRVGGGRFAEALLLLALAPGGQRRVGARARLLALQLDQLGGDLLAVRVQLAGRPEGEDRLGALAVEGVLQRLFVELPGGADAGEPLGPQHPLPPLARPTLLFHLRELAALQRRAVALRQLGAVIAVVAGPGLLVGEDVVRGREPLEPFREQRAEPAHVAAVPGIRMEAFRFFQISAADGSAVGVGCHGKQLVMGQPVALALEFFELALHVSRKIDVASGPRRRAQTGSPCRQALRPPVTARYPTAQGGERSVRPWRRPRRAAPRRGRSPRRSL